VKAIFLVSYVALLMAAAIDLCPKSKSSGPVILVCHGEHSSNGTVMVEPMLPARLGVEVIAGEQPTKGKSYNCAVENVKVARVNTKDGPTEFNRLTLVCGKTVLAVKEIILQ
jgi:hypothetical protein